MPRIVETAKGSLAGERIDGVRRFLGIPYAAPPVGALRLASPRPPLPWSGTRMATSFGPAPPQILVGSQLWLNDPIEAQDEDCLYLNVWAGEGASGAPVLVWFHGGATRNGHGGMAAIDGAFLARRHGLVVVTVNYRLGALGGLGHPALADPVTGYAANWGLQDKVAALRWVRDEIASFGGDPARVTIAGQSSGATDALLIAQNPDFRSLFARVIAQSPPLFQPPMLSDLAGATEYTEAFAGLLGTDVAGLRDIDGATLVAREQAFLRSSPLGRPRTAPTRDGVLVRDWPVAGTLADVPLLIGFTRDEAGFWYDLSLPDGTVLSALKPPVDMAGLAAEVGRLVVRHYPYPDAPRPMDIIAAYQAAMPAASVAALFLAIYTDLVFRAPIMDCASRHAARRQPAFLYEFAWPLAPPSRSAPHAAEVPFVFGNVGHPHYAGKVGRPAEAAATSHALAGLWASFVHSGDPGGGWPAWNLAQPLAVLGAAQETLRIGELERRAALSLWSAYDMAPEMTEPT
ncbi:carboxylesterase [Kaistia algarum]|uniref:carboxylesterase/lipase family protein n=1 Tax=Kaistia algarum TaxID=2083279 RepID=UPI000CE7F0FA|nr:carboxylesterase family protein [Kaistia algarum]MCX5516796.1 carboxylesterase family protein [Kaistia algarum]PPE77174.1 carboxylesterase [Kaistia algarum]